MFDEIQEHQGSGSLAALRQRIAAIQVSRMMWRMRSSCSTMETSLRATESAPRKIALSTQFVPGCSEEESACRAKCGDNASYQRGQLGYPFMGLGLGLDAGAGGESGGVSNPGIWFSVSRACC